MSKVLVLELRATDLKPPGKKEGSLFRRKVTFDSWFVVKNPAMATATTVKSEVVSNNVQPTWPAIRFDLDTVCNNNVKTELQIEVWTCDKEGNHQLLLGSVRTTPMDLFDLAATAANASTTARTVRKSILRRSHINHKKIDSSPHFLLQLDGNDHVNGKVFVVSASITGQPKSDSESKSKKESVVTTQKLKMGPVDLDDSNFNESSTSTSLEYDEQKQVTPVLTAAAPPLPPPPMTSAEEARRMVQEERMAKIRAAQRITAATNSSHAMSEQEVLQKQRRQQVQERLAIARAHRLAQQEKGSAQKGEGETEIEAEKSKEEEEVEEQSTKTKTPSPCVTDAMSPLIEAPMQAEAQDDQAEVDNLNIPDGHINQDAQDAVESGPTVDDTLITSTTDSIKVVEECPVPQDGIAPDESEVEAGNTGEAEKVAQNNETDDITPDQSEVEAGDAGEAETVISHEKKDGISTPDETNVEAVIAIESQHEFATPESDTLSELSEDVEVLQSELKPKQKQEEMYLLGPLEGNTNEGDDDDDIDDIDLLDTLLSDDGPPKQVQALRLPFPQQSQLSASSTPRTMNKPIPTTKPRLHGNPSYPYKSMFDSNTRTAQSQLAFVERMKAARIGNHSSSCHSLVGEVSINSCSRSTNTKQGNVFDRLYRNDIATYSAKRINKEYYA
jgi:hypothetical protein